MTEIRKISYTHDAMIDMIIACPDISQGELAQTFGYSQTWISIVIGSDAFQTRLKERKGQLTDPKIQATINDRLDGLAKRSLDKLIERLDTNSSITNADLIKMAALGVGDKNKLPPAPTGPNLYVVNLPPAAPDAKTWLERRAPGGTSQLQETAPGVYSPAQGE